jgi:very-short-patch-repair endonuclease
VIEVDGDSHFSDKGARYDSARTASLASEGIRVMRLTNLDVMEQFEGVCQRIQDALARSA